MFRWSGAHQQQEFARVGADEDVVLGVALGTGVGGSNDPSVGFKVGANVGETEGADVRDCGVGADVGSSDSTSGGGVDVEVEARVGSGVGGTSEVGEALGVDDADVGA